MLKRLYRCVVRLHPPSFRRHFGEEMVYIFDQQRGMLAALGVTLDCVLSLLRQWTLRPNSGTELPVAPLRSPAGNSTPSFETVDAFQPRASAMISGALLSLILFYMTVVAIPYSWIHVLNLRFFPEIAGDPTPALSRNLNKSSKPLPIDIIPIGSDDPERKTIASNSTRSAAPVPTAGVTIWLDRYVGKYISSHPTANISIQIENDLLKGDHLSLSLTASGHPSFALAPASREKFVIVDAENSYVDFTADAQGGICCLSLVINGNAIAAQRH
jgi:hypothetical protein